MTSTNRLLDDRIEFKLYAAKYHLNNLITIKKTHGGFGGMQRIRSEIEIDGFFAETIGAVDAVAILINEKLKIGLNINEVTINKVIDKISNKKNQSNSRLLKELNAFKNEINYKIKNKQRSKITWFERFYELRNHSIHRNMLQKSKHVYVAIHDNVNNNKTSSNLNVIEYFPTDPRNPNSKHMKISIIRYSADLIKRIENKINKIRKQDPRLQ
ncbi:MAG: hypothetical protein ACPKPY_05825 [Nitrososphaeraceae archaeon]